VQAKRLISIWFVIAAAALLTILGRILFPAYRDVFHGIIVLLIVVTMLASASVLPSEAQKTDSRPITTRTAVSIPKKHRHKKRRKDPLAPKKRKRKKHTR
jgi:hypothetical protein